MRVFICALLLSICINAEHVFVSCEGNYYDGNQGTLWTITNEEVFEYPDNPIGSIAQSLYVYDNFLFVALKPRVFLFEEKRGTHVNGLNNILL